MEDRQQSSLRELDLTDTVIQTLCGVGLKLEYCLEVIDESPVQVKVALADVLEGLDGLIEEARKRMYELAGGASDNG